ncbi:MAG: peptide deformylase [Microcoleus sp. PH2017_10_PVI_O_A]|uniref:peptide deformylase n=1 Tax=unclassified Microcoleus TaxID=2642155 RepID=UPI001DF26B1D|nr:MULTISPECIES: peptide deformylase [unclassified Microcoleus]TAE80172.1 MAG: peptide deformylase [Oscillatoriales cyanobacterium]MCC3404579.1 peptide deformylase [Microcoleus sp. PH2017_10_PVI_O_A]MCC3461906.1 peptide deformylase [Microcoleus sp. PH2017_11_PCY_U_A]MCC3480292.1 peptide deformylase [Microcoleus sp. PH2017_12_PCY_D_A]MCC3527037.1 peptide deformylase [Microcoleus sp. PH2017_21_RUC_O_A]
MTAQVLVEKKKLEKPPLTIHTLGDRVLRQPAKRVSSIDAEIRQLVREMLQTMYSADGIGLAAPQVGVNKQVIVIDCEPDKPEAPPVVLINPTIKSSSGNMCILQEGCLSIPGVYLEVKRPAAVEVSYRDEFGRPQTLKATELLATVIQHEMDHLNGVLFVDRVENKLALNEELVKNKFSPKAVKSV